jgi:predicted MPP superfamily phosphohydrolase
MTCWRGEQIDHAARILSHLRPARLATVGVLGNHDYGSYDTQQWIADQLTGRLREVGIDILSNARRDVQGLTIAGLDDMWGTRFHPAPVLAGLAPGRASLVLCHNPDVADEPVWDGYQGWILCGHTHGGQCKAPFLCPPLLPVINPRYVAGEVDLYDGRRLYINRGLGHLLRVRFNVRPEITVFTLQRA